MSASNSQNEPTASSSNDTTTQATPPTPTCANCNKASPDPETKPLKECTSCHSVSYCSRDCTKAHYKQHKKVCAGLAQEYSKTANFKMAAPRATPKEGHRGGLQKWQFDT